MARIPDIERRLLNWARWKEGDGSPSLGGRSVFNGESIRGMYREAIVPTSDVEASQTDLAVRSLLPELQQALEIVYLRIGTMEKASAQAGVPAATIYRRVDQAHARIAAWLVWRGESARAERERVEKLFGRHAPRKKEFYEL